MQNLRGLLGQLQWISSQTRPDISFLANTVAGVVRYGMWTSSRVFDANKALTQKVEIQFRCHIKLQTVTTTSAIVRVVRRSVSKFR